jgi:spore germination protein KA
MIVAGDPFALVVPVSFFTQLHSPEDNYIRWPYGNLIRAIRFLGLLTVIYLPGLYVAVVSYHPELIPTSLVMAIAASREPIPFPLWVEVTLMFAGFELIREAGIRIPSPIGPTIGIVGALLIGEAAVAASIVSPILVIVVAFTAVASFTIPSQELAMFTRLATLGVIFVGTTLGLLGIVALTYVTLCHAFSLDSLGMPYFSPLTPTRPGFAYGIPVIPPWQAGTRPAELRPKDLQRQPAQSRLWDEGRTASPSSRITSQRKGGVTGGDARKAVSEEQNGGSGRQSGEREQQEGESERE